MTSALVVADWNSSSKRRDSPGWKCCHEQLDFVGDGEAVVDDVAEIMGFLEAFQDVLERADQVENRDFGERGGFLGGQVRGVRLVGEAAFLFEFAQGEESGGVLEFLVFDELADEFPARIVLFGVLFGRLIDAWQQRPAFQIHQVGGHHDELGGEVDVEQLEGVDVVEILAGDALDGNGMDVHLVFFDEVEQEVERAFEDFEADFVVVGFHGAGGRGCGASERGKFPSPHRRRRVLLAALQSDSNYGIRAIAKFQRTSEPVGGESGVLVSGPLFDVGQRHARAGRCSICCGWVSGCWFSCCSWRWDCGFI